MHNLYPSIEFQSHSWKTNDTTSVSVGAVIIKRHAVAFCVQSTLLGASAWDYMSDSLFWLLSLEYNSHLR